MLYLLTIEVIEVIFVWIWRSRDRVIAYVLGSHDERLDARCSMSLDYSSQSITADCRVLYRDGNIHTAKAEDERMFGVT